MATVSDVGTGTTVSWATLTFPEITNVRWSGASIETVETTHMGTTDARTFKATDLPDMGTVEITGFFTPGLDMPAALGGAAASLTVNFAGSSDTWAASAIGIGIEVDDPLEGMMTYTFTCKITGDITVTDAA